MPVLAHGLQRTGSIASRITNESASSSRFFDYYCRLRIIGTGRGGNAVLRCFDCRFDELLPVRVIIIIGVQAIICGWRFVVFAVNVLQTNKALNGNEYEETDQRLEEETEKGVWVWEVVVNNLV